MQDLDGGDLNQKLGGNARTFGSLVHALARAARESTRIKEYRDACAKAVIAELKRMDPDRELTAKEEDLLVDKMDQVFKVRRRTETPPPTAIESTSCGSESERSSPSPPELRTKVSVKTNPTQAGGEEAVSSTFLNSMAVPPPPDP